MIPESCCNDSGIRSYIRMIRGKRNAVGYLVSAPGRMLARIRIGRPREAHHGARCAVPPGVSARASAPQSASTHRPSPGTTKNRGVNRRRWPGPGAGFTGSMTRTPGVLHEVINLDPTDFGGSQRPHETSTRQTRIRQVFPWRLSAVARDGVDHGRVCTCVLNPVPAEEFKVFAVYDAIGICGRQSGDGRSG